MKLRDLQDCDSHVWGTGPLWDAWKVFAEGGLLHLVDEDTEPDEAFEPG